MKHRGLDICGKNLGRTKEGLNRICFGRPQHGGSHGNDASNTGMDWGQAEVLLSDEELADA